MIFENIKLKTQQKVEVHDLTKEVQNIVKNKDIKSGIVKIRTLHTTTSIVLNEYEPCLEKDIISFLTHQFPEHNYFHHDDFTIRKPDDDDEYQRKNARAHLQALMLGSDKTISISNGALSLGRWQSILFLELDGPRAERIVEIIVMEDKND